MIPIKQYKTYFGTILSRIETVKHLILVSTEADLGVKIRDLTEDQFPLLVIVVPSADSVSTDPDNTYEVSICLIYLLQYVDVTMMEDTSFIETMDTIQQGISSIKQLMADDKGDHHTSPHFLHGLDLNQMHTDPEYNFFSCIGWSLTFNILTPGF